MRSALLTLVAFVAACTSFSSTSSDGSSGGNAGLAKTNTLDQIAKGTGNSAGSDAATAGTFMSTSSHGLVFAFATADTLEAGTGWTPRSTMYSNITEDMIATKPGSFTPTATVTGVANPWVVVAASFRGE